MKKICSNVEMGSLYMTLFQNRFSQTTKNRNWSTQMGFELATSAALPAAPLVLTRWTENCLHLNWAYVHDAAFCV